MVGKKCKVCGEEKPHTEFPGGRGLKCNACYRLEKAPNKIRVPDGFRRCPGCNQVLPKTLEYWYVRRRSGREDFYARCKPCCKSVFVKDEHYYRNLERQRQARALNPNKAKAYARARYAKLSLDQVRAYNHNRRARKLKLPGKITATHIRDKFILQDGRCYYCSNELDQYHADHKIPLFRGGTNWPANICIACPSCNLRKQASTPKEFLQKLSLYP